MHNGDLYRDTESFFIKPKIAIYPSFEDAFSPMAGYFDFEKKLLTGISTFFLSILNS